MSRSINRRCFLHAAGTVASLPLLSGPCRDALAQQASQSDMAFGLVTYLWGKDMDLPALIACCEASGLLGVELRTEHRHGVEPSLSAAQRADVRKRFEDSSVTLVGYGSNAQFHEDDPAAVRKNIELTKSYVHLMHDCGGSGVKVKPNGLVRGVPPEKTIAQIGNALNQVAAYAEGYGQQIRVEVHGRDTSRLPVMKAIFDVADHPNATICWNSNQTDLDGEGLEYNFGLVKDRLGATVHVRELDRGDYPYRNLFQLLNDCDYKGWILLEARTDPEDPVAAMRIQRRKFEQLAGT